MSYEIHVFPDQTNGQSATVTHEDGIKKGGRYKLSPDQITVLEQIKAHSREGVGECVSASEHAGKQRCGVCSREWWSKKAP